MSANELKATHEALRLAHEKLNKMQTDHRMQQIEHAFQIQAVTRNLDKYKEAVKRLAFDLEMAQTGRAVVNESAVRKAALEQAAEFLMDHGVITSGGELETVCEQIKRLHPSQAVPVKAEEFL